MKIKKEYPRLMLDHFKNFLEKRPDYKDLPDRSLFFPRFDAYISLNSWVDGIDIKDVNLSSMLSGGLLAEAKMMQSLNFLGHFGATVDVRRYMLNFPASRIALLWIPKNSCTSVKRIFLKYEPEDLQRKIIPHEFHESCQTHFGINVPQFANGVVYPKIAIIRHPYERIVSCYLDKFVKPVAENKPFEPFIEGHVNAIHRLLGIDDDLRRSVSFSEFIFYIFEQPAWSYDSHWRPQCNFINDFEKECILLPIENISAIYSILGIQKDEVVTNKSYGKKFIEADGFIGDFSELIPASIAEKEIFNYNQFISKTLSFILFSLYSKDIYLYKLACSRFSERNKKV